MNIDSNYINELENIYRSSLKRYSIQEMAEIFLEAKEIIREKIIETLEGIFDAEFRIWKSYSHTLKVPEILPLAEAVSEDIFKNEIIPLKNRYKRLCFQNEILNNPTKKRKVIDIDGLKSSIDLRDLVGGYIHLRRVSERYSVGKCLFHNERTPSFTVYRDHYFCFGCQEHGSVIDFIMKMENVDFKEALNILSSHG